MCGLYQDNVCGYLERKGRVTVWEKGLPCRWDLFPGITGGDFPASSEFDAEVEQNARVPSFPTNFSPARLHRVSKNTGGAARAFNDLLAQTFDVRELELNE